MSLTGVGDLHKCPLALLLPELLYSSVPQPLYTEQVERLFFLQDTFDILFSLCT